MQAEARALAQVLLLALGLVLLFISLWPLVRLVLRLRGLGRGDYRLLVSRRGLYVRSVALVLFSATFFLAGALILYVAPALAPLVARALQ